MYLLLTVSLTTLVTQFINHSSIQFFLYNQITIHLIHNRSINLQLLLQIQFIEYILYDYEIMSDPNPIFPRVPLDQSNISLHQNITLKTVRPPDDPHLLLISLTATTQLSDLSSGTIDSPTVYQTITPSTWSSPSDLHFLGFQCSEFALPVRASDTTLQFDFFSREGFVRPKSIFPLIIMRQNTRDCLLLAPLDNFHEQVLAVSGEQLKWGWSGDLNSVPESFTTTLACIVRMSIRDALDTWGTLLREKAEQTGAVNNAARYADISVSKLSYWTDNGAAYWYRTEPGLSVSDTLEQTIATLDEIQVPVASVELDSWFYPHEKTRKVQDVGYLELVPPTGMLRWEPRKDVLGEEGIEGVRRRIGNRPLILHSRHISSQSSYIKEEGLSNTEWWIDSDRAHPSDGALFHQWMRQAAAWGATTFEQDWLVEKWLGVRQLREEAGRIETWQKQLNQAAAENNIKLIWCMATPADIARAVSLSQIVAIRSCDDYRYAKDPSILWRWHLTVSCMLRSLGFYPFKDVFLSHQKESGTVDIDGDPNAMLEACLSALSAGPVGIGDRKGKTDKRIATLCCRADGVLIKPDVPIAALDRSLRNPSSLLWADTNCGLWRYVLAMRTGMKANTHKDDEEPITESLELSDNIEYLVLDWNNNDTQVTNKLTVSLRLHEWKLWVVCPIFRAEHNGPRVAFIGDKNTFATMGDRRVQVNRDVSWLSGIPEFGDLPRNHTDTKYIPQALLSPESQHIRSESGNDLTFQILGAAGEQVELGYWSETQGLNSTIINIPQGEWCNVTLQTDANTSQVVLSTG